VICNDAECRSLWVKAPVAAVQNALYACVSDQHVSNQLVSLSDLNPLERKILSPGR
jgi:hypothetical protein